MKSIKLCSELDISVTLHTFLQKIAYQPKCKGESNTIGCDNGYAPNGTICTVCKGVGYVVHESSQDAIYLSLPRNKDDAFDLTKLIHYQDIPIDILKFLKEHLQDVKDDAISAVYNGEALIEQSINKTATAKTYDMQNVYDALYPLAQQDAAFRIFQIELIAGMNDLKGVIVEYSYPKDFKMRGLEELMDLLEKANKSGAPMAIRSDISNDIAAMMFQDRPNDLKKLQVKQQFNPFDGKNVEEINIILVNDLCTKEHKIMWSESATIFAELEEESMQQTVTNANAIWFYDLPYKDQKTAIQKKVAEIVTQIEADQPVATQFDATGVPVGAAPAPVAPAGGQGGAAL
jgi:hypothetical protein